MIKNFLIYFLLSFASLHYAVAENPDDEVVYDYWSMTKAENIRTPAVPSKMHNALVNYMKQESAALVHRGYNVELERNGEVIVITIPTSELFLPNDTVLRKSAYEKLNTLTAYLKAKDRFKMILAMHSDNTGSMSYKEQLTEQRLHSVEDFLTDHSNYPALIVGYAMADDEPLVDNNSRRNRELNRRLEIFIVPSDMLIDKLKK